MKFFTIFFACFFLSYWVSAQRVNNVRAAMDGNNVKILYNLEDPNSAARYDIKLYCSFNNFSEPLKLVSGSTGKNIKPGVNLAITWTAQEELVNFKGDVTFEVRATLIGSYYTITNPSSVSKFKKGKLMPINWQGGESGDQIKIELVKLSQTIAVISESVGNQGSYIWTIPKSMKPSGAYQVKISKTSDVDSQGISKMFRVKGKSAAPYILIPLLIGGGVGAYIMTQGGGPGPEPVNPPEKGLPLPPTP